MEPPPLPAAPVPPPPESSESSPRSRTTDGLDDLPAPIVAAGTNSMRLMCSYGGHIVPRPHDRSLCYVGGDTRIISVDRTASLAALIARLSNTFLDGRSFTLKYQLPSEDLDSLISVTTDEDLDNLIDEYDRTSSSSNSVKSSRLRLFLFPSKPESTQSMGQILETSAKSDDWFLSALNSAGLFNRGFSDTASINSLLGLDDVTNGMNLDRDGGDSLKNAKQKKQSPPQQVGQDVHSVPESPKLDTTSSFESTSSPPSMANLPPIRVHVEDTGVVRPVMDPNLGIEDQFAQITLGQRQQQQEEGFDTISMLPPPSTVAVPGVPMTSAVVSGEYLGLVYSEDDRSDHDVPVGHRKLTDPQPQPHNPPPAQAQQKSGGYEMMSPDSVSSENSQVSNPLSRPKPIVYQEPVYHIPSGMNISSYNPGDQKTNPSDPGTRIQIQDSGYVLQHQFEQQNTEQQQQQHQQQQHQHQLQQQQQQQQFIYDSGYVLQHQLKQQNTQQQQQQQQFIHAAQHYINPHPNGAVQIPGYIPVYPSSQQQPLQQPYPVYYIPSPGLARETQAYNFPIQQSGNMSEAPESPGSIRSSRPQTQSNPTMSVPQPNAASVYNPMGQANKPEMGSGGVYRTTVMGGPPHQHQAKQQFVGYSQVHHPAQFVVPSGIPGGDANLGYQYSDMAHGQIYYGQPPAAAQYKTVLLPDGTTVQLPTDPVKQQIRSSQPL